MSETLKRWFGRYGANLAGVLWNSGNGLQFILGAVALSPRILVSSALNVASSSSSMLFGHKDWGVVATSALGVAGTVLFLYPNLADGDARTWAGFSVFFFSNALGILNVSLSKRFARANSSFLKATFGRPRRMIGTINFLSRLPIIWTAIVLDQGTVLAPFVAWALGDLTFSLSKEEAAQPQEVTALRA